MATVVAPAVGRAQDAGPPESAQPDGAHETEDAPTEEERLARTHFEAGRSHFERGRYDLALTEFDAAYELSEEPGLLYNIFLAHERLGHLEEAASVLERYLPHAGPQRATLEERLTNIRARLEQRQRDANLEAQRRRDEEDRRRRAQTEGGGGVGAGAVAGFVAAGLGLVAFGVFAVLSEVEDADLAERCGRDAGMTCSPDDVSQLETYNIVADVGLAVGVAGALVGTMFLLLDGGGDEAQEPGVSAWVAPHGAGAAWRQRF
jgi:tetratricopeptide (TPR) repeat protein